MTLTNAEIDYLASQRLGRLATVQADGSPQVKPVGFLFNPQLCTIDVTGFNMAASQKFRNVGRNGRVALVVDDIASEEPWRVRFLEIRGTAEAISAPGGSAGAGGADADLLDLQAGVHQVSHQEGDRLIGLAGCHPEPPGVLAVRQDRQGPPMVVGDLGHADAGEHLPRRPVDGLQERELCHAGRPDTHQVIVAACRVRHHLCPTDMDSGNRRNAEARMRYGA